MSKKDIAIVGMACNFPGSKDIAQFWQHIRGGKELTRYYSDDELAAKGISAAQRLDPHRIHVGSEIAGKDSFDAPFFGYSREEASLMDPQIRLFHEYVWKALDDAGCDPYDHGDKIGLFAGASENLNWTAYNFLQRSKSDIDPFFANIIGNKCFASTLISYKLNLRGPSYFIDTACSTSLVLVHLACRSLLMRECGMAVAGAVCLRTDGDIGYTYRPGMINSSDGRCRTFDAQATGTLPGEGIGVVVLKRLEQALEEGDYIYGVIRSTAVNNDGGKKVGFTAPGTSGQADVIRTAHKFAEISPADISYIEAHGTATRLGDPIEIDALNAAFEYNTAKNCAIGSVKSNMGHLDRAAGMAGLIKTVLALQHKELPPSLHFSESNPEINFANGPFFVNTTLRKWERVDGKTLMAGVSSFGIGGTNAHVVLAEPPGMNFPAEPAACQLLVLSAKTESSLQKSIASLHEYLQGTDRSPADIAYTLQTRKKEYKWRYYKVLKADGNGADGCSEAQGKQGPANIVFLFPGQGSQYVKMGKGLYDQVPLFREIMDQGFDHAKKITGQDLRNIWLGSADTINQTLYAQPLLFLFEYALATLLMRMGIRPGQMIGHSIGELVAACIGEVFTYEKGIGIVLKRAELMDRLPGGAMLSVQTGERNMRERLSDGISIAAVNSVTSCVVSGQYEAIAKLGEELTAEGIGWTPLKTSHAFHSEMMGPAVESFREAFRGKELRASRIPYYSNVSGRLVGDECRDPRYWSDHIRHTVRFSDGLSAALAQENSLFIEVGPGTVLSSLCKDAGGTMVLNMVRHPRDQKDDMAVFLDRLGSLWTKGSAIDWDPLHTGGRRQAVPVPSYQFDSYRWPTEIDAFALIGSALMPAGEAAERSCLYLPAFERSFPSDDHAAPVAPQRVLILSDGSVLAERLAGLLAAEGHEVKLITKLVAEDHSPDLVIYFPAAGGEHVLNLLALYKSYDRSSLFYITRDLADVGGNGISGDPLVSTGLGLLKVIGQEAPSCFTCGIDVSGDAEGEEVVRQIYRELIHNRSDGLVCLRNGHRWIERWQSLPDQPVPGTALRHKGTYVITGGLGRLGRMLSEYLLQRYEANLIILSRSATPGPAFDKLKQLKGTIRYYSIDVGDIDRLAAWHQEAACGKIDGIIHAAGNTDTRFFKPAGLLQERDIENHFSSKVSGLLNICRVFAEDRPDFVWCCSSLSTVVGGLTFGAYVAANTFMDYFALTPPGKKMNVLSVNLDGLDAIPPGQMISLFESSFKFLTAGRLIVSMSDLETRSRKNVHAAEDRSVEPGVMERPELDVAWEAPATPTESLLADLWSDLLGYEKTGVTDNFFDLGGDSLKAMNLTRKIHRTFGVDIPLDAIFSYPTIRDIAGEIDLIHNIEKIGRIDQGDPEPNNAVQKEIIL